MVITGSEKLSDLTLNELFEMRASLVDHYLGDPDVHTLARLRDVRREIADRIRPLRAMIEGELRPLVR